jgi:hypothetical protein
MARQNKSNLNLITIQTTIIVKKTIGIKRKIKITQT